MTKFNIARPREHRDDEIENCGTNSQYVSPIRPLVHIIIVTYNSDSYISTCLESVTDSNPSSAVTVVDNASTDSTVATIRSAFPQVEVLRMNDNAGFGAANNKAIGRTDAPWVLILNPDTRLSAGAISRLIHTAASVNNLGILGCRLVTATGEFDHAAKRAFPTPRSAAKYMLRRIIKSRSDYLFDQLGELDCGDVDCVNGAFMLIPRDVLADVGNFDTRYWMYAEDIDLCRRVKNAGYRVWYEGSETVIHLKGASSGRQRKFRLNWQFHRSMALYFLKFDAKKHPVSAPLVLCGIFAQFVASATYSTVFRAYANLTRRV